MLYTAIFICLLLAAAGLAGLSLRQRGNIKTLTALFAQQEALLANLREAYRDLEATRPLRELGQSAAFVNHEIKNYMTVISGYALLLLRSNALDAKSRAMADNIAQATAKLQEFSQGVLELSKVNIAHENIEIDLAQKIRAWADANFPERTAQVSVECEAHSGKILANGSPGKLERALVCALQNSFEAGARQIGVRLYIRNHTALIVIDDDGAGCDAAQLPNLHTTFFSTKQGVTGLGLSIMRSIIETHGGNVGIYPKNLSGSGEHGMSVQITIAASKKAPHTVATLEVVLIKDGLDKNTAQVLKILKNLKIIPRTVETAKSIAQTPKNGALGMIAIASARQAEKLAETAEIKTLVIESAGGGAMLVRDMADNSVALFTEEYAARHLCR